MICKNPVLPFLFLTLISLVQIQCDELDDDDEIFPDFSCIPGYDNATYGRMWQSNIESQGAGPNTPNGYDFEPCPEFNMMFVEFESDTLDLMEVELIQEGDQGWDEKYIGGNRKYWIRDTSEKLTEMFGEEQAGKWMQQIKTECQPVLHRVFFEEGKMCSDDEADTIYDCINHAIGCSDQDWVPNGNNLTAEESSEEVLTEVPPEEIQPEVPPEVVAPEVPPTEVVPEEVPTEVVPPAKKVVKPKPQRKIPRNRRRQGRRGGGLLSTLRRNIKTGIRTVSG